MNLATRYMGLNLKNPVIASASPLSETLDGIRKLEDGGVSAIVLFSLFEEQIQRENAAFDRLLTHGRESNAESLGYFPELDDFSKGPDDYLNLIRQAREATDIPIIASLNCISSEGWTDYARQLEAAGASGIELNIYGIECDFEISGLEVEQRFLEVLRLVKQSVGIPVAMKLSPFFSAFGHMAKQLDDAGADGLVLFNRFYQPDFNIDTLEVAPTLTLSRSGEIRLPLLWIAMLYGRVSADLAATRGVETAAEVIKYLLAGANVVMTAAALLREGSSHADTLVRGLSDWMVARGFESIDQMRGIMSYQNVSNQSAFQRANYIHILESYR